MDGKEAIIKRIRSDADKKAKDIVDSAEKTADERKAEAEAWANEYKNTQEKILAVDAKEIVRRRLTVADLDVRKKILEAKQSVIGEVLSETYDRLCSMKKADYLKFVEKNVSAAADENDEIVLSSDGVLTADDVKQFAVFSKKNLTVSKEKGDFKGGVYLVGKVCDKDLTFKAIIENDKDEFVSDVSEQLFGK